MKRLLLGSCLCGLLWLPLSAQTELSAFLANLKTHHTSVEAVHGLFNLYRAGDKIYLEMPDSLFGRDLMITHTLLEAAQRRQRRFEKKYGYAGDLFGPIVLRFRVEGDEVKLMQPLYVRQLPEEPNAISCIAALRGNESLLETFQVQARGEESVLFDATDLLTNSSFFLISSINMDLCISTKAGYALKEVRGFPDRLWLKSEQAYLSSANEPLTPGTAPEPYRTEWLVGTCLSLLPEQPIDLVQRTDGSYFYIKKELFDGNLLRPSSRYYIKRWRMEVKPEDKERYARGELVEPVAPIIFYIDRHTPTQWIPYIKEAVEAWQEPFERAGFKQAIQARLAPAESDSCYAIYDSRHPFISWKASPQKNAYGPTPNEPRAGEVMACHVGVYSSVPDLLRNWYFVQCGAADEEARQLELPDALMGELMKMVITHEIGHTLGLEHNFYGSSMASVEQLRDNDYLSAHGITSSVMDYVRCNHALRPGDHTDLRNRISRIGEFDRYIIEWGYRCFPGKDATERDRKRQEWAATQQQQKEHRFVDGLDVYAQSEDLGSDPIAVNRQGMENLKYLCGLSELWKPTDTYSLRIMQKRYEAMRWAIDNWSTHVLSFLGGKTEVPDGGAHAYRPMLADECRRAVEFAGTYLLNPPHWLFDEQMLSALEKNREQEVAAYSKAAVQQLFGRIKALLKVEQSGWEDTYTVAQYLSDMHRYVYAEWTQNEATSYEKQLVQQAYAEAVAKLLGAENQMSVSVAAWNELKRIVSEGEAYMQRCPAAEHTDLSKMIEKIKVQIDL